VNPDRDTVDTLERWAASGVMALTGRPDVALGPPAPLVAGLERLGAPFPGLDPVALLGERAALLGLGRHGTTSCGGGCRLLATRDGSIALSLARPEDHGALEAWLECEPLPAAESPRWDAVAALVSGRSAEELVARGQLLMLPLARLGEAGGRRPPVVATALGAEPARPSLDGVTVIDLSALWAGPLCGHLLARAGASVIKVESIGRPDGSRRGPLEFFDLLNGEKRSVALELRQPQGVNALVGLLRRADVVIEASRPRALEQLGIVAEELVRDGGPAVWVSITGHGRAGPSAQRVAFGDDAAVAGGLVADEEGQPRFCGDAIADPLAGLTAAGACQQALTAGGRWLLDVSMAAVAADLAGPTLPVVGAFEVAAPRARPLTATARPLGADTTEVLETFGLG
jgi:hypothetical protein